MHISNPINGRRLRSAVYGQARTTMYEARFSEYCAVEQAPAKRVCANQRLYLYADL